MHLSFDGEYASQSSASFKFDSEVHTTLVEHFTEAVNERDSQRLKRCAQPHANNFVTAVPSNDDGKGARIRPHLFRTAVQYRLGVPLLKEEIEEVLFACKRRLIFRATTPLAAHGLETSSAATKPCATW